MRRLTACCGSPTGLLLVLALAACGRDAPEIAPRSASPAPAPAPAAVAAEPAPELPAAIVERLTKHGVDPTSVTGLRGRGDCVAARFTVAGAKAIAVWESLRALAEQTGWWPVILGAQGEVGDVPDDTLTPAEVIANAAATDLAEWLEKRRAEDPEAYEAEEGRWPSRPPVNDKYSVTEDILASKPHPEVWIALVPTPRCWEVPAYLPFGDWNDCPPDEVHVAALRRYHDDWGAELVCLSRDTMELRVPRRPADRKRAAALAREHFLYCYDLVAQGVESLNALAADRMTSPVWYFWWD
jgi:hypothetical protein